MEGTRVPSLGWEDPLEEEMATQYSCFENLTDRGAWRATVQAVAKSQTLLSDSHSLRFCPFRAGPSQIITDLSLLW